ncbi:MAG TPA: uracil-DNA glycosylase [Pyrinomonadaceae bacterium]|nr:uracil-DNA glycosylase [Pyrinomonadaceae bacterium]
MNEAFTQLVKEAAGCTLCPAMCGRRAVLSELNGSPEARVMFIGEAPGRKGADRTRVPFSGDQSGANFDRFLSSIKLTRKEIFITSAALCNPRSETGANRKPTQKELANCSRFLRRTIETVDPNVIVTLGSVALEALKRIEYHELNLRESASQIHSWNNRVLVPIYHPSPQVLASHRREAEQLRDYQVVGKAILLGVRRPGAALAFDHELETKAAPGRRTPKRLV